MVRLIRSVFFCAFALGGISASALASEIQLPKDYAALRCLPAYDGDDCLPTGYVRALASKSDADRELWELELLIDSMNDKVAEPSFAIS